MRLLAEAEVEARLDARQIGSLEEILILLQDFVMKL
jgi:hypothetical protein